MPFSTQVVVTQELEPGEHRSLRILSNHAKKEDVEEFLRKVEEMNTPRYEQQWNVPGKHCIHHRQGSG